MFVLVVENFGVFLLCVASKIIKHGCHKVDAGYRIVSKVAMSMQDNVRFSCTILMYLNTPTLRQNVACMKESDVTILSSAALFFIGAF